MRTSFVPALAVLLTASSAFAARWDSTSNPNKFARVTGKAFVADQMQTKT